MVGFPSGGVSISGVSKVPVRTFCKYRVLKFVHCVYKKKTPSWAVARREKFTRFLSEPYEALFHIFR